ncbi:hypothetical protein B5M42_013800 [Paenibacillus athensensis]|uniref:Uncharacterized protein n=1 Tax=Paenibacillus athensensis TaxID=1967502 RepID=A0A4Y8PXG6_9BACL|nr:hypothetical protein [Paenibacillus athensensis]MCD1259906.1 hypothetical protein [Paenibacillus athensensis]
MSEFSESYHYRTSDPLIVKEILKNAQQEGYVLPPENGWVTFVVKDSQFEPLPAIVNHNPGMLLHYVYAEDHGYSVRLFDKSEEISQYFCDWDDEIRIRDDRFDLQPFFKNGLLVEDSELEGLFSPASMDELFHHEPYYRIAQLLGLPYYEWFSYHSVAYNEDGYTGLLRVVRE